MAWHAVRAAAHAAGHSENAEQIDVRDSGRLKVALQVETSKGGGLVMDEPSSRSGRVMPIHDNRHDFVTSLQHRSSIAPGAFLMREKKSVLTRVGFFTS